MQRSTRIHLDNRSEPRSQLSEVVYVLHNYFFLFHWMFWTVLLFAAITTYGRYSYKMNWTYKRDTEKPAFAHCDLYCSCSYMCIQRKKCIRCSGSPAVRAVRCLSRKADVDWAYMPYMGEHSSHWYLLTIWGRFFFIMFKGLRDPLNGTFLKGDAFDEVNNRNSYRNFMILLSSSSCSHQDCPQRFSVDGPSGGKLNSFIMICFVADCDSRHFGIKWNFAKGTSRTLPFLPIFHSSCPSN